jgi:ubiquinone/menaquinone biosynthesis C-methylase UbiE
MTAGMNPHDHPAKQAWQSPAQAALYRHSRNPAQFTRYDLEEKIIGGWLDALPRNALVLDIPCGTGRLLPTITRREFRYVGADFSLAMINEARHDANGPHVAGFLRADAEHLPLADGSVDCVVIWRLFHHLGNSRIREALLGEAARVSRGRVLISFHHALSFTAFRKFIQRTLFGRKQHGRPITHWRLEREAARSGLRLLETRSFGKYRSINWFACLDKAV